MLYPCVFVAFLFFDFFENAAWQPQGEMRDRGANADRQITVREFLHYHGMGQ